MRVPRRFAGEAAIVIGTGPSLAGVVDQVNALRRAGRARVFGINNTPADIPPDVWIACDPTWHAHYGRQDIDADCWHWDAGICERYGYRNIEGRWFDGVSTDPSWISYNHSSGAQALNLAVLYGCDRIALVGFDMSYRSGRPRHYFKGLSGDVGEYPGALRKDSPFEGRPGGDGGLLRCYEHIAAQDLPCEIVNCTPGSAMTCFPIMSLEEWSDSRIRGHRAALG